MPVMLQLSSFKEVLMNRDESRRSAPVPLIETATEPQLAFPPYYTIQAIRLLTLFNPHTQSRLRQIQKIACRIHSQTQRMKKGALPYVGLRAVCLYMHKSAQVFSFLACGKDPRHKA